MEIKKFLRCFLATCVYCVSSSRLYCPDPLSIDIVFFIFLYQRWIYRVDPKRVNEFGTSGEDSHGAPVGGEERENGPSPPRIDPSNKKTD